LIWPQLVGFARAKEYLFTGDLMTAAEAELIGLINHVVPVDQLDEKVYGLARRRDAVDPLNQANRQSSAAAAGPFDDGFEPWSRDAVRPSKDHQEAVWAFAQKRRPNFTGR
jgi:enoyl-CoA hydratase